MCDVCPHDSYCVMWTKGFSPLFTLLFRVGSLRIAVGLVESPFVQYGGCWSRPWCLSYDTGGALLKGSQGWLWSQEELLRLSALDTSLWSICRSSAQGYIVICTSVIMPHFRQICICDLSNSDFILRECTHRIAPHTFAQLWVSQQCPLPYMGRHWVKGTDGRWGKRYDGKRSSNPPHPLSGFHHAHSIPPVPLSLWFCPSWPHETLHLSPSHLPPHVQGTSLERAPSPPPPAPFLPSNPTHPIYSSPLFLPKSSATTHMIIHLHRAPTYS